ncbi:L-cysteine desulfidase family protein [Anaerocolumna sp.]|uniref:L-cysteine desulfidase family protein n=1 Tax=Anaerocolumna sp. TaxID=2041569 RepID=UPI0028A938C5|nr:L-serine ammonia-lyase, iron-sulfur-dependent, subunit alpha [Anaerocolumna sp.]
MNITKEQYDTYINILKRELVPALGCTEPIAIAYGAAKAREILGGFPDKIVAECSGNIIKNAKGVIVPTTRNLKGIEAASIIGAVGGDPSKGLEVLRGVKEEDVEETRRLLAENICETKILDTPAKLHIIIKMYQGNQHSLVEIIHTHTGIVRVEKNGEVLLDVPHSIEMEEDSDINYDLLNVEDIVEFSNIVDISEVEGVLAKQIKYNTAIAKEGLRHPYGASIGATLLEVYGDDIKVRAKAMPAAGSDARMSGCELPVVINSGSGNQGMTASLPVIEYGKRLDCTEEKIYRALCISNLIAIYQKSGIGRLSAYCGAVSAAAGAGAGITYLYDGSLEQISQTITNTLANVSGIICDGAKSSCAAKIASSVDAAIVATMMSLRGKAFAPGDGIVKDNIENTVDGVVKLAKEGMKATDDVVLKIMVED